MKIKRALISVSDKKNLDKLIKILAELKVEILSTGGTAKYIRSLGVKVTEVSQYTGFPEIMDGRVKTLHPKIHGALLGLRDNPSHVKQAKEHGIIPIDMVVINLYPFADVISRKGVKLKEAIENIDIGGPSILRSAAKNFKSVAVISNPDFYENVISELKKNNGSLSEGTLRKLAEGAFKTTSEYDKCIHEYLNSEKAYSSYLFPDKMNVLFEKIQDLRYGENPHQKAAFYRDNNNFEMPSLCTAKKIHGKELSFNNLLDLDAALSIVNDFNGPAACIIKHATPCGVATDSTLKRAFINALDSDKLSAFGGIIGLNRILDTETAKEIEKAGFIECIISSGYDKKALAILTKKKSLRLIQINGKESGKRLLDFKKIHGGVLFQEKDTLDADKKGLKVVTKKRPTAKELDSLYFAWKVAKHVKSNAIVVAKGTKTVGIGSGQTSRVDSVVIALRKAAKRTKGAVLSSDGFFPKPDSIKAASKAGISSIIQPGGSIADNEIIKAADKAGISMVFTGIRHFKH